MNAGTVRGISLLMLGIILGSLITNIYIGSQLDHLSLANSELRDELADVRHNFQKLKEATETKKKNTIESVEIFLLMTSREGLTDYDEISVEHEAKRKVKEWLNPVIGQDMAGLDGLLIPGIVDNREIEANGNKYLLRTYLIVVNRKTCVYIKAARVKPDAKIN